MVESLVGVLLIAEIVLCSVSSFVIGKNTTQLSKRRFIVSNLLREDMENYLATSYTSIPADGTYPTPNIAIPDGTGTFLADKTLIIDTPDTGTYGYKTIYGKIEWHGGVSGAQDLLEEIVMYVTRI